MFKFVQTLIHRHPQDGASAVEYGLLVAGIAALIVVVVFAFGGVIRDTFQSTCDTVASNQGSSTTC